MVATVNRNPDGNSTDWRVIRSLLPYLWEYRSRVVFAMLCLGIAKVASVCVPLILKDIVDKLDATQVSFLILPLGLLLAYGGLRLANALFSELRDVIFAKVTQRAIRRVALQVFRHLHALSLRFHLARQTGGVSRDIERGTRGISFLLNFMLFNILPTLAEILLVTGILLVNYDVWFAIITLSTIVFYITFTLIVTEQRMHYRRTMNNLDSKANTRAIDSLLNYETVKYFSNEDFEANRYDDKMQQWEFAAIKNQYALSVLNFGQGAIIAIGMTLLMVLASQQVVSGDMTMGDLVLVNAFLLQLYMPLGFLGFVYREIKYSLADMEKMFALLHEHQEIQDQPNAPPLHLTQGKIEFRKVDFSYEPSRIILKNLSFTIEPGQKLAVVGHSGAGKSTLSRLLYRFYDVTQGAILIDGQDIRDVNQKSLRAEIGIVPQDTVLFNDTIEYNIAYAKPNVTKTEIEAAAQSAHIDAFIEKLPEGYETLVGERGLKLSGGEKQRVAIARTILKNPKILIFDEATSALDSKSEQVILRALREIATNHTTLVIAHRLSTIVDADQILVMDNGCVVEQGSHQQLLSLGKVYANMWALQQKERSETEE
ncbi:MAG: ABC transporter ATP-binding protein/permease [Gammaproteobacteria bacterium]|nr:ABC transporter ATP-binding protein/permease [Gammaproteobacteria bacterium]